MTQSVRGTVLVGHGGIPKDCPRDLVMKLKRLESERRASGGPPTAEEREVDRRIRTWPRTAETDPYQAGLELLAEHLGPLLNGSLFALAYNEFCAPTLEEAVQDLVERGARDITVISSMFTPGGSHSELEIPEALADLRTRYPDVAIRYAWPFDLKMVAEMLAKHVKQFSSEPAR